MKKVIDWSQNFKIKNLIRNLDAHDKDRIRFVIAVRYHKSLNEIEQLRQEVLHENLTNSLIPYAVHIITSDYVYNLRY